MVPKDLQHGHARLQAQNYASQDVTHPSTILSGAPKHGMGTESQILNPGTRRDRYMNQSLISLIATVGSNANMSPSSKILRNPGDFGSMSVVFNQDASRTGEWDGYRPRQGTLKPRAVASGIESERNMLMSMPTLPKRTRKKHKTSLSDAMTSSQILERPPPVKLSHAGSSPLAMNNIPTGEDITTAPDLEPEMTSENTNTEVPIPGGDEDLADMLSSIFGFEKREEVLAEYPCMLMQSSLVRGYLYILERHVCFYAYLPKRSHTITKSGFISKRGRNNPIFHRYWFTLKGDVLSYYTNPSQLYFPRGTIDLRSATSTKLATPKEKNVETSSFSITTPQSVLNFKGDSPSSAKEWVKQIQEVIFHSQNDGESIKIVLPSANLLDMEESPIIDVADTFRLRVIDNDETYAVDEYFFSFFGCGSEAFQALRTVMERNPTADYDANDDRTGVREEVQAQRSLSTTDLTKNLSAALNDTLGTAKGFSTEQMQTPSDSPPESLQVETPRQVEVGNDNTTHSAAPGSSILQPSPSSSKLQELLRAGAYPLQKASGIAGLLRSQSMRVGSIVATESLGYYEKAYSMWAGKKMHYDEVEGPYPRFSERKNYDHELHHGNRFRSHFSLPPSEKLLATYYSFLHRVVPVYGKIYVGSSKLCFRALLPGTRTKMILPLKDIENVVQEKGFRFGYAGLVITIRGHEEIFFEFGESDARDDCAVTLLELVETARQLQESRILSKDQLSTVQAAKVEHEMLQRARRKSQDRGLIAQEKTLEPEDDSSPILFDDPLASFMNFKPPESLRITCLTIGSRGDVQPFIALCKGLMAEGHRPIIATHVEFGDWIKGHGIEFAPIAGNPAEIMRLCVENDMFTISFIREAHAKFRGVIDDILESAWKACQGTDLLIESPSAMAGIHIAEALQIPYFRAFTMPWTRTRAYPHAFAVPTQKLGGNYNIMTYVMFDTLFWQAMAGQINRWRRNALGLPSTNLDRLQPDKVPFLYNFSPAVVIPPLDFNHWIRITGYWFLDEGVQYTPAADLKNFIRKAREDDKKIVYVGFGSVVVDDPAELTRIVVEAILEADVRCILSKGWSDRLDKEAGTGSELPLPDAIFQIQSAPHDWLFRQVDAAAHHGGAGTTGASIRAGIPTITKPFFGDQYFFGSRIEDLGVGVCLPEITKVGLAHALHKVTTDVKMIERAKLLGQKIRSEDGVETAIQAIYRDLDYARSLIKKHSAGESPAEEVEESWTLVGNDSDPDIARRFPTPEGPEFQSSLAQRRLSAVSRGSAQSEDEAATLARQSETSSSEDEAESEVESGLESES